MHHVNSCVHGRYTLVQVAFNDVLIFVFYIPTMMLLLEASSIRVPWDTAFLAVALFLFCPGLLAYATRWYCKTHRKDGLRDIDRIVAFFKPLTMVSLLAVSAR
jgi:ACR3 family arsenite efflux pump ArsB